MKWRRRWGGGGIFFSIWVKERYGVRGKYYFSSSPLPSSSLSIYLPLSILSPPLLPSTTIPHPSSTLPLPFPALPPPSQSQHKIAIAGLIPPMTRPTMSRGRMQSLALKLWICIEYIRKYRQLCGLEKYIVR